ncbi:protein of unknown function [Kyrpidia spormannii]|uniref:Uncharacterized protein n=1 Tax=Kyrpidia spormannii TaxID=2055160 RepID=A0ACA8Z6A3_9BACL|nr:protein of unknown function [Kyrpidia spormannii]
MPWPLVVVPHEVLLEWCRPLDTSQSFYRPFVCRTYELPHGSVRYTSWPDRSFAIGDLRLAGSLYLDYTEGRGEIVKISRNSNDIVAEVGAWPTCFTLFNGKPLKKVGKKVCRRDCNRVCNRACNRVARKKNVTLLSECYNGVYPCRLSLNSQV